MNPLFLTDFYKVGHRPMYPEGTEMVYSNFTPRSDRLFNSPIDYDRKIVVIGLQALVKEFLITKWNDDFFNQPKEKVISEYKALIDSSLGADAVPVDHVEALHDLGYLPLHIRALPEGSRSPMKVPVLTIWNTIPEFFWLVNYLESVLSAELWGPMTTATIAFEFKRILIDAALETGGDVGFVPLQGHDFSFRGLEGWEPASKLGVGHLASFIGTDTIPAIVRVKKNYPTDPANPVGVSVPASEHSVACMNITGNIDNFDGEVAMIRRFITELFPTGIVSLVSDSYDYWSILTEALPLLKDEIMARQPNAIGLNKVVIRPDSGDPIRIICGYKAGNEEQTAGTRAVQRLRNLNHEAVKYRNKYYIVTPEGDLGENLTEAEVKGSIQVLWDIFGGTETDKGFKLLDEHIGLIYGDSITTARAKEICERLAAKGFASTNVVFGIGSYSYQYNTRDTFGFAMKATFGVVNGEGREIFKDPKTADGTKKSAKGLFRVDAVDGTFMLSDRQPSIESTLIDSMQTVFLDGKLVTEESWETITGRLADYL